MRITRRLLRHIDDLKEISNNSDIKKRHGACLIDHHGNIIGKSHNYSTRVIHGLDAPCVHAEVGCIIHSSIRYKMMNHQCHRRKYNIMVIRTDLNGEIKNSRPCTECVKFMLIFGIKEVFYSNDKGEIINEKVKNMIDKKHYSFGTSTILRIRQCNEI